MARASQAEAGVGERVGGKEGVRGCWTKRPNEGEEGVVWGFRTLLGWGGLLHLETDPECSVGRMTGGARS